MGLRNKLCERTNRLFLSDPLYLKDSAEPMVAKGANIGGVGLSLLGWIAGIFCPRTNLLEERVDVGHCRNYANLQRTFSF